MIGEGELTIAELLAELATRRTAEVAAMSMASRFAMRTGAIVRNAERAKIEDLDSLPFPDRETIDHQKYLDAWKTHHGASSINLITARGCPYRCNWCSHAVYGHSHRRRSPANVADEVQWIIERYDPDQVWYADDVFTISHPWLESYAKELASRGIHGRSRRSHAPIVCRAPPRCGCLQQLGCYRIWIGSESGSQRILNAMQRGVRVEQVREISAPRSGAWHSGRHVLDVGL